MSALPSFVIDPLWDQFAALIPARLDSHPWGCHRPRIPDQMVFDKLIQVLVFGIAYVKAADRSCSATTLRERRDEWIAADLFVRLEQICVEAQDRIVGLDLSDVTVDGCIVEAPAAAKRRPLSCGQRQTRHERSMMVDGAGVPLGWTRRLLAEAWLTHRWDNCPTRHPSPVRAIS